ncbi:MAG TPA: hypothetical protein VKD28_14555, partial [Gemmatimonadales bacterium]|nr:hypothetical protein [Gemmatimonadales bacterium]
MRSSSLELQETSGFERPACVSRARKDTRFAIFSRLSHFKADTSAPKTLERHNHCTMIRAVWTE